MSGMASFVGKRAGTSSQQQQQQEQQQQQHGHALASANEFKHEVPRTIPGPVGKGHDNKQSIAQSYLNAKSRKDVYETDLSNIDDSTNDTLNEHVHQLNAEQDHPRPVSVHSSSDDEEEDELNDRYGEVDFIGAQQSNDPAAFQDMQRRRSNELASYPATSSIGAGSVIEYDMSRTEGAQRPPSRHSGNHPANVAHQRASELDGGAERTMAPPQPPAQGKNIRSSGNATTRVNPSVIPQLSQRNHGQARGAPYSNVQSFPAQAQPMTAQEPEPAPRRGQAPYRTDDHGHRPSAGGPGPETYTMRPATHGLPASTQYGTIDSRRAEHGSQWQHDSSAWDSPAHDFPDHAPENGQIEEPSEPSLDYDLDTLYKMDFHALQAESYDNPPRGKPMVLQGDLAAAPLEERMRALASGLPRDQQAFFASLSIDEWEDAGDWFQQQFSAIFQQFKKVRREKRAVAQDFERLVAERHEAVTRKRRVTDDALREMKRSGQNVLTPRKKSRHLE